jgi:DNA helicase-2/ATP-dependent DNA helicase PcrA
MTRAKDHLHLVVPHRFLVHQQCGNGDRHMYAVRTRFIPSAITKHFEQCAWPPITQGMYVNARSLRSTMPSF